jgi:hypothetical protein
MSHTVTLNQGSTARQVLRLPCLTGSIPPQRSWSTSRSTPVIVNPHNHITCESMRQLRAMILLSLLRSLVQTITTHSTGQPRQEQECLQLASSGQGGTVHWLPQAGFRDSELLSLSDNVNAPVTALTLLSIRRLRWAGCHQSGLRRRRHNGSTLRMLHELINHSSSPVNRTAGPYNFRQYDWHLAVLRLQIQISTSSPVNIIWSGSCPGEVALTICRRPCDWKHTGKLHPEGRASKQHHDDNCRLSQCGNSRPSCIA